MLDSPGIMVPSVKSHEVGMNLALAGATGRGGLEGRAAGGASQQICCALPECAAPCVRMDVHTRPSTSRMQSRFTSVE